MKSTFFAAALVAGASAATVKLQQTECLNTEVDATPFDVEIGTLFVKQFDSVCGFKFVSVDGVNAADVTCHAFKDAEGKEPGSAGFTSTTPAFIATNSVQEGSIKCDVKSSAVSSAIASGTTLVPSGTAAAPSATGGAPQQSANGTAPTAGTPTGNPSTTSGPAQNTNAAGRTTVGACVLAVGFAALLL